MGLAPAVFILPEDIELTAGPAAHHRQFLDMYISQYSGSYLRDLVSYRKVLLQRNRLLKEIAETPNKQNQLEPWDKLLIEHGARIIEERKSFVESIEDPTVKYYANFNGPDELTLLYLSRVSHDDDNWAEAMAKQLKDNRAREIRAGLTLVGPHRDRLVMNLKDKSVRHYGSRGQKRCVMLAMKLAVADYLANVNGKDVILILDEVFAELDSEKSLALMKVLANYRQVFIATAGDFKFDDVEFKKFYVENGKIEEIPG